VFEDTTILVIEDDPDHVGLIEAVISRGLSGARVQAALRGQGLAGISAGNGLRTRMTAETTRSPT
jgi:hypothetical protein